MDELGYKKQNRVLDTIGITIRLIGLIGLISIIFLSGANYESKKRVKHYTSKQRIEPQLKITIEGGKSDTLFIYKKD